MTVPFVNFTDKLIPIVWKRTMQTMGMKEKKHFEKLAAEVFMKWSSGTAN